MQFAGHVEEDALEKYAMGLLCEADAESVEDHFALCVDCLDRMDKTLAYVQSMQWALRDSSKQPATRSWSYYLSQWESRFRIPAPMWAAVAIVLLGTVFLISRPVSQVMPATVILSGTRGTSMVVHGTGPFDFKLFMPESSSKYHVVLLNDSGRELWQADTLGVNGQLHAYVGRRLPQGQYYLRVTDPVSKSVHDYGVRIAR